MTGPLQDTDTHNLEVAAFRMMLLQSGLLLCAGADDIPGYSAEFETIIDAVSALIGRLFSGAEVLKFPALISRKTMERSRYIEGFPQLAGLVECFCGDSTAHRKMLTCIGEGEDWSSYLEPTNAALTPASCYPVYPLIASRGPVKPQGCLIDVSSHCFRHEPSIDPIRLQMFRQREYVFIGTTEQTLTFLDNWLDRTLAALRACGLSPHSGLANDAFFGRFRTMLSTAQRTERLKTEILLPISRTAEPNACGSCNNHKTHFSAAFGIKLENGGLAQTACAGFGLERLALALIRRHGPAPKHWPAEVRATLTL